MVEGDRVEITFNNIGWHRGTFVGVDEDRFYIQVDMGGFTIPMPFDMVRPLALIEKLAEL